MDMLTSLPPEVLREIVNDLAGDWLINLWLTGSKSLLHTLSTRSGITSVTLLMVKGPLTTSRLPSMLDSLTNLTSLTIKAKSKQLATPERLWECFSKLNQLRTLSLKFREAEEWMFEPEAHSMFETDEESDLGSDEALEDFEEVPENVMRPVATVFPHLESLTLEGTPFLANKDLSNLPRSLTTLALNSPDGSTRYAFLHLVQLPNLADISIFGAEDFAEIPATLPASTTVLNIRGEAQDVSAAFWNGAKLVSLRVSLNESSLVHLPPTLETLTFEELSANRISLLHLPHLKSLSILRHNDGNIQISPLAPLEHFKNYLHSFTSADALLCIPKTVKDLELSIWDDFDVTSLAQAAGTRLTQLTSLSITSNKPAMINAPGVFQLLPPTLTSLVWSQIGLHGPTGEHLTYIPPNLTKFDVNSLPILDSQLSSLPRKLTELSCGLRITTDPATYSMPDGSSVFPSTLTKVKISSAADHNITASHPARYDAIMNALPPHLLELKLFKAAFAQWTPQLAKRFSSLRCLHLNIGTLESGAIAELSRSLVDLDCMFTKSPIVAGAELKHFPRSLRSLWVHRFTFDVKDEDLADLPPRLYELAFPDCPQLTKRAIEFLPKHCKLRPVKSILYTAYKQLVAKSKEKEEEE